MDSSGFKSVALLAAKEAGKVFEKYYGKKEAVKVKQNKTLAGVADDEADNAIISVIKKNFPEHSILSEESGFHDNRLSIELLLPSSNPAPSPRSPGQVRYRFPPFFPDSTNSIRSHEKQKWSQGPRPQTE